MKKIAGLVAILLIAAAAVYKYVIQNKEVSE